MTTKINPELAKILSKDKSLRPDAEQILERLSVQKDSLPNASQKEALLFCCKLLDSAVAIDEAIVQTLENAKEKPDAEYVPTSAIQQKPINEAQLKEIAARYSMGDRISEINSALKLKPEGITTEQFEQFREVCEQVQQGMALPMVAQGVLNKAKATPSASGGGTALAPRKDSTLTTDRPFPAIVEQGAVKIEHAPLDGEAAALWGKVADIGASTDAQTLANSPFDGIREASDRIRAEANGLKQHGAQIYFEKFGKAFNDPALLKKVAEQNLGKFPPEWDLNSKIQL
jgi:hypothetical protein